MRTFINLIVKNKINFINLLAATYHGQVSPFGRLPLMILTGLICSSDTDNYVLFIWYIISFKNHIAIYDNQRSYQFYEIWVNFYGNVCNVMHIADISEIYIHI